MSTFLLVLQDKVTKEVNFILANQETIQSQITQLEAAIKQMEVSYVFYTLSKYLFPHTMSFVQVQQHILLSFINHLLYASVFIDILMMNSLLIIQ